MYIFRLMLYFFRLCSLADVEIRLENIALHSQLALIQCEIVDKKISKPNTICVFRMLWVFLSDNFENWKTALVIVKPETVLGWHKRAFKSYWRKKSKGGRPEVSSDIIAQIKRIHKENSTLSPKKIHERLMDCNRNIFYLTNSPVFVGKVFQGFLTRIGIQSKRITVSSSIALFFLSKQRTYTYV